MQPGQHHQMQMNQAQLAAQQQLLPPYANDLNKRKSRKPIDKALPFGIEDVLIDDGDLAKRYHDLRDFERRLDATITRKRVDIFDSMNRNAKVSARDETQLLHHGRRDAIAAARGG